MSRKPQKIIMLG